MTFTYIPPAVPMPKPCNVVAYDPATGEILQTAHMRPARIAEFTFPGQALFLLDPAPVSSGTNQVDPETLAILPRPECPLTGQSFTAPATIDLSWCPAGAELILHNEDGDIEQWFLPLEDDLILTDPGRYILTLNRTFPYQEFTGVLEVADA